MRAIGEGTELRRDAVNRRMGVLIALATVASALIIAAPTPPVAAQPSPAEGAPAVRLSAGQEFTCALLTGGTVRCWGRGGQGKLGQSDVEDRGDGPNEMGGALLPVPFGSGRSATSIAAGQFHSCAILDDATVKCWGDNSGGQLGVGARGDRGEQPGELGDQLPPVDLGTGRSATAISAGGDHSCAILDTQKVKCWGIGSVLGTGDDLDYGDDPNDMGDLLPIANLGAQRTATAVSSGAGHNCAVLDNHKVKCWGGNSSGQLGLGDTETRGDEPGEMGGRQLPASALGTGRTALAITTGSSHTCALLDDRTVKCWGSNSYGQLGIGDTANRGDNPNEMGDNLPRVDLGVGRTALALSADGRYTCALLDDQSVKCWGRANAGQLGQGDTAARGDGPGEMGDQLPRIDLGTGRTATAIEAGDEHACAVLDDGGTKCWGWNGSVSASGGALGLGDSRNRGDNPNEMGDHLPEITLSGPAIFGRVSDQITGEGVAGQRIAVLAASDQSMAVGTTTNPFGNYAVQVPTGTWYLYLLAGQNSGWHGAPTPVPVTTDAAQADPVLRRLDGNLVGTIRQAGTSNPATSCACYWAMALDSSGEQEAIVDGYGPAFAMALPAGQHHVVAIDSSGAHAPRFYPSATDVGASTAVSVTAGTTTTADPELPTQTTLPGTEFLSGFVTDERTGAPVTTGRVVVLRASDYSFVTGSRTNEVQGSWGAVVPVGDYVIGFLDPGRHEFEWYQDQPGSGLGSATIVTAPADGVDGALTGTAGTIRGSVGYGATRFTGIWVLAIGPNGIVGQATSLGIDGYEIDRLAPGNYRVAFLDTTNGRVEFWPDRATFADATVIPISAGDSLQIDADLASPP